MILYLCRRQGPFHSLFFRYIYLQWNEKSLIKILYTRQMLLLITLWPWVEIIDFLYNSPIELLISIVIENFSLSYEATSWLSAV